MIKACPSILALGKAEEIKAIKAELGASYEELIKACPYILVRGKAEEIRAIIRIMKNDGIDVKKVFGYMYYYLKEDDLKTKKGRACV